MLLPEFEAWLTTNSLTTGYTVVKGKLPLSPDKVIVLNETSGVGADLFLNGSPSLEQPGVQVLVRDVADEYAAPRLAIERIYQAALESGAFTASGTRYLGLTPLQPPFKRNQDENQRIVFAFTTLAQKALSATV